MLFVTSDICSSQAIPISGLQDAQVVTYDVLPRGPKLDMHSLMPYGPVGKPVMLNGVPLHPTPVGDGYFTTVTRDPYTGNLNPDTNPTWFPNRIHGRSASNPFSEHTNGVGASLRHFLKNTLLLDNPACLVEQEDVDPGDLPGVLDAIATSVTRNGLLGSTVVEHHIVERDHVALHRARIRHQAAP